MGFFDFITDLFCGKCKADLTASSDQIRLLNNKIIVLNQQAVTLTRQYNESQEKITELFNTNQKLTDQVKLYKNSSSQTEQEMEDVAYKVTSLINGGLHVGLIWADKGIVVQINPDSQVGNVVPDQLAKLIDDEMKTAKYIKHQQISDKVHFFSEK